MISLNQYQLASIVTSRFGLDGGAMFGIIPKPLWEKKISVDDKNRIEMVTRSLLIIGEDKKILVDTGNGDKWSPKLKEIYKIDPISFDSSLAEHNLTPDDITDVILTHLHFDHAGGATKIVAGEVVPTFANARYYVQKANYQRALSASEKDRGSYLAENWEILKQSGMLEILDGPCELFPKIELKVYNGHTPGQQFPFLSDGNTTIFYSGDLFPTHAHIPLAWVMSYDLEPLRTIEEKKQVLAQAVEEKWILFFGHDANHTASYVIRKKKDFAAGETVKFADTTDA